MDQGNTSKKTFSARAYAERASKRMRTPGGVTIIPAPATVAAPQREPILTRSSERLQSSPAKASTATSSAPQSLEEFPFTFPKDFGFALGQSVWPYLHHFKLPGGIPELEGKTLEEHLQEGIATSFKVTQMNLHALEMFGVFERRMLVAEDDSRKLGTKVGEVLAEVDKFKRMSELLDLQVKESDARVAAEKDKVAQLTADLAEKDSQLQKTQEQLARKKDQVLAAGGYFTYMARIECMEEHAAGKSSEWDLAAEKKALEEAFPEKPAFSMSDCVEDHDVEDVSSKVSPTADVPSVAPDAVEKTPAENVAEATT